MICQNMRYRAEHTVFSTLYKNAKCLMNGPEIIHNYFAVLTRYLIALPNVFTQNWLRNDCISKMIA